MNSSKSKEVFIVNCGLGNIYNLCRAITLLDMAPVLFNDPEKLKQANMVILPGVGSFNTGMERLKQFGLDEAIKSYVDKGDPLLGICLGMQLFFESSEENGHHSGLNILSGKVTRLCDTDCKIPQINWNYLKKPLPTTNWDEGILRSLSDPCMYFIHSYGVNIKDNKYAVAKTNYGINEYCSVVNKENIWGCQFHPEISGKQGLKIIENFLLGC